MKAILKLLSVLMFGLAVVPISSFAQKEPVRLMRSGSSFDHRDYGNGAIADIVAAETAVRMGKWEEAILTYDNVVAQWPYWAPVYVKRAMAKYRMGRFTEAEADLNVARRLSLNSVRLFSENNPSGRMGLLRDYPADIDSLVTDDILAEINTLKRSGQFAQAAARLDKLWTTDQISPTHYALLRGNLEVMLNDYRGAIAYYDSALKFGNDPSVLHNRGLARILNFNYVDGCQDLLQASEAGYAEALDQWTDLCNW